MPGLTAPLAVLAPLAFRFLPPRPPRLFRPDPLLRARRPRVRAVHTHRRSISASRNSSLRSRSRDASSPAVSAAICSSFASITARSRDTRSPCCSPAMPGSSDTNRKHAQPALKVQPPQHADVSRSDPVNGHPRAPRSASSSAFLTSARAATRSLSPPASVFLATGLKEPSGWIVTLPAARTASS